MKKGYELIIAEKPSASLKIAEALAEGKIESHKSKKATYYSITHKGKEIVVACAVGHLYTVAEKNKHGWTYPTFDTEWKASYEINKESSYTKEYLDVLKKLVKEANEFTIATDFDIEGEVIGERILHFLTGKDKANRMKFSTTTKEDLLYAYENKSPNIELGLAKAGITRHELDFLRGINLSRALSLSIKAATNRFKIMSSGRVQGPALNILYEKEKEIEAFKSEPYWELYLHGEKDKEKISAVHEKNRFWNKKEVETVKNKCKSKTANVKEIIKTQMSIKPPVPFDLTTLQIDAYATIGTTPKQTLEIAQELYTNSYISYPRTSSQKLPPSINYKKIINNLSKAFPNECEYLIKHTKLKPIEGKKTDEAHPAIHPTGELPKKLEKKSADLYELIVRRFFATFGKDATKENCTIKIDLDSEIFLTKGSRTLEQGWQELYGRFVKSKDEEIPKLNENDKVSVKKLEILDKETQPPKRYTEASIIKELESKKLGTKSTRAIILDNLFERKYITDKSIKVTDLGKKTVETLLKYAPDILDEKLTRDFEEQMEEIRKDKIKSETVIENNKKLLTKVLTTFKKNEKEIGKGLGEANYETEQQENQVGTCQVCKKGILRMRRGKFGQFIACDQYEQGCKTTFSLPKGCLVKPTGKLCKECNYPTILIIRKAKKPQELCINPNCKTKEIKIDIAEKKCPKCGKDLVIRKGMYGAFAACPGYPKCKYIEGGFTKK